MTMDMLRGPLLAAVALILIACAAPGESPDESTEGMDGDGSSRPPFGTMPPLDSSAGPIPTDGMAAVPGEAWASIVEDLSRRVGRDITDPTVIAAGPTTFADGSLGCPQRGQMYTQAIVEGYRVIVEIDGEEYDYRVGASANDVRLCESGSTLGESDNS